MYAAEPRPVHRAARRQRLGITIAGNTATWLAAQLGMEDIAASPKTLLMITTTSNDEDDGVALTTTTIREGRETRINRSLKYVCVVYDMIIRATKQVNVYVWTAT